MHDDVERQLRVELARIVAGARSRRRLSQRAEHGGDDVTRRQLDELGILSAEFRYLMVAIEEVAVGLVAGDLLGSALAHWTGQPSRAVVWAGPTDLEWGDTVTGRLAYVPQGGSTEDLLLVRPDSHGARVGMVDLRGAARVPVPVLDRTRPAASVELRAAPVRTLRWLTVAEATRLRAGWLVALAADCLGGMRAAHETALDYARQRMAFGRAIGSFQAVRHRCADMFVDVSTTRAVVRGAVAAVETGAADALVLALAAASHALDAFSRVADSAILVHGGLGFTYECDAHFYARRAYSNAAWLGSPDALRTELAHT